MARTKVTQLLLGECTFSLYIKPVHSQTTCQHIILALLTLIRSVSNANYVYNFHTDENGLLEVTAVNVSNFPRESEPQGDPFERSLSHNAILIPNQMNQSSNRHLAEDGSLIDVICFYTRLALCNQANQAATCSLDQYKYLMDAKCALAISETVCFYIQ